MLVLFVILVLEYFDKTIKNPLRAEKLSGLELISAYPKLVTQTDGINYDFVKNRLMEQAVQKIRSFLEQENMQHKKPVNILIFSTQITDGKSLIQDALSKKLREFGYSVLSANYSLTQYHPKFSFQPDKENKPIEYILNPEAFNKKDIAEIIGEEHKTDQYDFVLIEIPSVTHQAYPPGLIKDTDMGIMVARANRLWTSSDEKSLAGISRFMSYNPFIFLNGVQPDSLEMLLGELPRKRSKLRRILKKIVKLQFFERHSLSK